MSDSKNYEPTGLVFYDKASNRTMMIVSEDEPRESIRGWLLYRHPDGQWVTLRKATDDDHQRLCDVVDAYLRDRP